MTENRKVWNQVQLLSATAKAAGTYNDFTEFTVRSGAKYILGFYVAVADAKPTDGENGIAIIRINSTDLGVSNETLIGPTILPDGDAATTTTAQKKKWYPWTIPIPSGVEKPGIVFSITTNVAKELLDRVQDSGKTPSSIVDEEGLSQVSDLDALRKMAEQVLADNPDQVATYQGGKTTVIGWFVGQIMKQSKGKANPQMVREILEELLAS